MRRRDPPIRYPFLALLVFAAALAILIAIRSVLPHETFRDLQSLVVIALIAAFPLVIPFLRRSGVTHVTTPFGGVDLSDTVEGSEAKTATPIGAHRLVDMSIEVAPEPIDVEPLTPADAAIVTAAIVTSPFQLIVEWVRKMATEGTEVVPIDFGAGDRWLLSRLYLLAFLLEDFTFVRLLVFTESRAGVDGYFLGKCAPRALCKAIERDRPAFDQARRQTSRDLEKAPVEFAEFVADAKADFVDTEQLRVILGEDLNQDHLETYDRTLDFEEVRTILDSPDRYVVLTRHGKLESVVDQYQLAVSIARTESERWPPERVT